MADKSNKRLYQLMTAILLLVAVLIGLILFYSKKAQPLQDIAAQVPAGIKHIASIYGPKAGDNFDKPESVGIDEDNNIYVADTGNHRIAVFDSNGNFKRVFGDIKTVPYPLSVAVAKSGKMYVTSLMYQRLTILDKSGKPLKVIGFKKKAEIPLRVKIHKNKLYMTTVGHLMVLNMDGKIEKKFGKEGRAINQFEYPNGIVIGKVDKLKDGIVVSDSNNNRIQIFTNKGKPFAYLGNPPKNLKDTSLTFGLPTGIDMDEEGRVFVMDSLNHSVRIFDNKGNDLGELGQQGSTDGTYYYPTDIVHVEGKRFIITDKWNDRVQICELEIGSNPKPSKPKEGL